MHPVRADGDCWNCDGESASLVDSDIGSVNGLFNTETMVRAKRHMNADDLTGCSVTFVDDSEVAIVLKIIDNVAMIKYEGDPHNFRDLVRTNEILYKNIPVNELLT
jgi:hypothetical protein